VPQQGVSRSPTGDATALVVGAENKVERRRLKLERAVGNQWLVLDGLKEGDKLIVEGLQRARPGQAVTPVAAGSKKEKKGEGKPAAAAAAPAASSPSAASAAKGR
jgi:membrane fusion protein (multidrug efflux system)